jgi:transposase
MARNFKPCDRDQLLLLPPDLRDWLPEDHLAWFVCDAVHEMSLTKFLEGYREDGRGGSAYHPETLVSLLLYAYCQGISSSRQIERLCQHDIGFRVIVAQQMPDHTTIARFRRDFAEPLAGLFVQILELCKSAGLIKLGNVALDGTKIQANAALEANLTRDKLRKLADELIAQAEQTDAAEDELYGKDKRGDELPEHLADPVKRKRAFSKAREKMERVKQAKQRADDKAQQDQEEFETRQSEYEQRCAKSSTGKAPGRKPKPPDPVKADAAKGNTTDPCSRILATRHGWCQGYNAQAAISADGQIILCAEICDAANDMQQLAPMIEALHETLQAVGLDMGQIKSLLADSGYNTPQSLTEAHQYLCINELSAELLIPPPRKWAKFSGETSDDPPPDSMSLAQRVEYRTKSPSGSACYKKRREAEAVFGQIKGARGLTRFRMRGAELVDSELKLMAGTHNLLKLWRHKNKQRIRVIKGCLQNAQRVILRAFFSLIAITDSIDRTSRTQLAPLY